MAQRGDDLNTRLTATDDASKVVDKVAEKVADLEDREHDVDLGADTDEAEQKLRNLDRRLDEFEGQDRRAILKAQADQAIREIAQLEKRLANASKYDDETITIYVRERGDAAERLERIRDEIEEIDRAAESSNWQERLIGRLDRLPGRFGEIGGMLGNKLGAGIAAGLGAAAVGKLIVDQMVASVERSGARARLQAALGLSDEAARENARLAREVFNAGFGENEIQLGATIERIRRQMDGGAKVTEETIQRLAANAVTIAEIYGRDVNEILRSASQLVENGLVPTMERAFDVIVTGFQRGGDEAGDWLETIDEYAQHWQALGLTAEQVLAVLLHGIQNGQRDTDKMADALKEFRIRAVEDSAAIEGAYARIGLDADRMRELLLGGGDEAAGALQLVIDKLQAVRDPIEKNALAIQFFGTQFEDLGPKAFDSLDQMQAGVDGVAGAAQRATQTATETERGYQGLWRNVKDGAKTAGDLTYENVVKPIGQVKVGIEGVQNLFRGRGFFHKPDIEEDIDDANRLADALERVAGRAGRVPRSVVAARLERIDDSEVRRPWEIVQKEIDRAAERVRRFGSDGVENMNQVGEAASGVADELVELGDAFDGLLGKLSEERSVNQLADQWDRVLEAQSEYWEAEGRNSPEAEKLKRDYRDELGRLAEDVARYARQVGDVPEDKLTRLAVALDSGSLTSIEHALDAIFADRSIRLDVTTARPPTRFKRTDDGGWEQVDEQGTSATVTRQQPTTVINNHFAVAPSPSQTYGSLRDFEFANGNVAR